MPTHWGHDGVTSLKSVLSQGDVAREPLAVEVTGRLRRLILNNELTPGAHSAI